MRQWIGRLCVLLAACGGGIGILATFPVTAWFGHVLDNIFPLFHVTTHTLWLQAAAAAAVGLIAAIAPAIRSARINVVDGLHAIG